jgi:microcystin-dependent protein
MNESGNSTGMVNGTIISRSGDVVKVDIGGATVDAYSFATAGIPTGSTVQLSRQEGTASVVGVIDGPSGGVPVGFGGIWFTNTPPAGWLICDGSTFSATDYPALAAALGTTTLPDHRDRFPMGKSATKAIGSTGGSATHTITTAEMPSHVHAHPHTHTTGMAIGTIREGTSASTPSIMFPTAGGTNTGPESITNTNSAGSGNAMDILNPYSVVNFIIYAGAVAA